MKLRGDYNEQYSLTRDYVLELKSKKSKTNVKIDVEGKCLFYPHVFITWGWLMDKN